MLAKLYLTISIGAIFFRLHGSTGPGDDLSWIDCYYFATVVATSIGYGDITPSTDTGKAFLSFYFLFATIVVGSLLGDLIDLYVRDYMAEFVTAKLSEY